MLARFLAEIYLAAAVVYPTTDGQMLQFAPEGDVHAAAYQFALEVEERPSHDEPENVVMFRVWVADSEGDVWTTTIEFTASKLGHRLVDEMAREVESAERMPEEVRQAFEQARPLSDVFAWYSDDVYVPVRVDGEEHLLAQEYLGGWFDVAVVNEGLYWPLPFLAVRTREGLPSIDGEEIPAVWYHLDLTELWRWNGALWDAGDEMWMDSALPVPLVFERTNERAEPQPTVTVR